MPIRLICKLTRHRINRSHVWHDGIDFRTECQRCRTEMIRGPANWREFDPKRDSNAKRGTRPVS